MGCKKYWNFQMNHCAMTPKAGFCSNIVHNGTNVLLAFCKQIHRPLEDGQTCSFLFGGDKTKSILFSKIALFFGYPAYSHHDRIPPWWVFVRNDNGGSLSGDKFPP